MATAGLTEFAVTHSTPPMIEMASEMPVQLNTWTGTSCTCLAIPWIVPPTVPATWVPWPWQSRALPSGTMALYPGSSRPAKSGWSSQMPVSMM